jgi:hypothetical protein
MSALSIQVPFPVFQDRDGQPLDNGYVWLGLANLNPQTNPVVAYFDSALTIIAAQPLRTINGYISNSGTPAQVFVDELNFSILVQDSKGSMVYNFPDATGINQVGEVIYPQDYGAVGDGSTNDTNALIDFFAALAGNNKPIGDIGDDQVYLFSQLVIPPNVSIRGKSVLRANSSLSGSVATITVQGAFSADTLHLTTAGTETNTNLIVFEGDDVSIQNLVVESDTQFGGTGGVAHVEKVA